MVLLLTSVATIGLTIYTINKWKTEYKTKAYFECASKVLKTSYSVRDNFASLRAGFISALEYPQPLDLKKDLDNTVFIVNNRLGPFKESLNEYYSFLPEIEALFGSEIRAICNKVNSIVNSYYMSLNEYLQLIDNTNNVEHLAEVRKTIFSSTDNDDRLKDDLDNVIIEIETEVRKYMLL